MQETQDRVRQLIEAAGLTHAAFADQVGLDPTKLSKSLNGSRRFSSLELAQIAEFGRVSVDWLLTGDEATIATAARSAGGSARPALDLAEEYATMRADLAEHGYRQEWRLPKAVPMRETWIMQGEALAASALVDIRAKGLSPSGDLATVIETVFGIDVAVNELGIGFDGLAVATPHARLIIVDATSLATRQRFTMAHELGHLFASDDQQVHADENIYSEASRRGESEVRANAFASALLMPESEIRVAVEGKDFDFHAFCDLATQLKVSPSALAIRLERLRVIDAGTKQQLQATTGQEAAAEVGKSDVFALAGAASMTRRAPASLVADTFRAYQRGEATLRPYAQLLGVDSRTLRAELAFVEEGEA